jgi:hypothetical protein
MLLMCMLLAYAVPGVLGAVCGPGLFSANGLTPCTVCPPATPFSTSGAASCSSCASGCEAGSHGVFPCLDESWTVWYDASSVELSHSCVKAVASTATWANASVACGAFGVGHHLLTSSQVKR